jgi:NADPH:quinone reductase-like Zn-dependent oxidoreductase
VTNHPRPQAEHGRVLVRIRAAGLNRSELFTRQGHSPSVKFPRVLGIEAVGEVVDNGGDSTWKQGDKVAAVMGEMGRDFDGTPHPIISNCELSDCRGLCGVREYAKSECE